MELEAACSAARRHSRSKRFGQRVGASIIAATALALGVASAHAYDITTSPYLTGDWDGLRTCLAKQGMNFNLGYGSEVAHDFSGGTGHLMRYTDQWVIGTALGLQRLVGWQGTTFQATATGRNGRNLGSDANIGNNMLIQEVYGRGQTWHLTQFWLNQKLLNSRLEIKAGRVTVGEDFFSFPYDFQDLTFCGSQPGNLVGGCWVNWPTSQWGARAKVYTSVETYAQIGVYQVNPNYVDDGWTRYNGWKLNNPDGTTGALIPLEFGWMPTIEGRPGTYRADVWYNISNGKDLYEDVNGNARGITGLDAKQRSGQYGVYLNLQQQIMGAPDGRGTTVFLNFSQVDRNTTQTNHQTSVGVQYKGPLDRLTDTVGFTVGTTHNNGCYADFARRTNARTGANTVVGDGCRYVSELYYSWSPVRSVCFRLNLQCILHPGDTSQNKNAFVIGLKTGVTF